MAIETMAVESAASPIAIYPIGKDAVATVLRPLFKDFSEETWPEYLDIKSPMLEAENPYANEYLMAMSNSYPGNAAEGFKIGVTLAYEIFRQRAGEQELPILSLEFIQFSHEMRRMRMLGVYGKHPRLRAAGAGKEEEIRKGLFAMLEKEAYQVLQEELVPGSSIFDNFIFSGVVASYFLFREGFSDPNYWEPEEPEGPEELG